MNDAPEPDVLVVFKPGQEFVGHKIRVRLGVADEGVKFFVLVLEIDREELSDRRVRVKPDQDPVLVDEDHDNGGKEE